MAGQKAIWNCITRNNVTAIQGGYEGTMVVAEGIRNYNIK